MTKPVLFWRKTKVAGALIAVALLATSCALLPPPPSGVSTRSSPPKTTEPMPPPPITAAGAQPGIGNTITTVPTESSSCSGVRLEPGDDLQAAVDAAGPGTTFCLGAGVYRGQELHPKSGDELVGSGAGVTVLNGSNLIGSPVRFGSLWYAEGQVQDNGAAGYCADNPACARAEVVYIDDRPLTGVTTIGEVSSGRFFFDYVAHRVYFADDPTGHKVEVSAVNKAIVGERPSPGQRGGAVKVVVRDLTVEKYAEAAQQGAIETNDGWVIENVTTQLNGGQGITMLGAGPRLSHSRVLTNGQIGVGANGSDGTVGYGHAANAVVVDNTEIAYNNFKNFDYGWEAGGTKFWQTNGSVIAHNWVHHNYGPGLWDDGFNDNIVFSGNLIEDNDQNGIFHEIGGRATIVDNLIRRNGGTDGSLGDADPIQTCRGAICISSGKNVEIAHNGIFDNGRGIILIDDPHYPDPTSGVSIHDNNVWRSGDQAVSASLPSYGTHGGTLTDFAIDANHYSPSMLFGFNGAARPWTEWHAAGFDPNGALDATADWPTPAGITP